MNEQFEFESAELSEFEKRIRNESKVLIEKIIKEPKNKRYIT
jgi:hypothetical protein